MSNVNKLVGFKTVTISVTMHCVHCTLYTVHCTLYAVHCTLYTVQFEVSTSGGQSAATTQRPITVNTAGGWKITNEGQKMCLVCCLNILFILSNRELVKKAVFTSPAIKKQSTFSSLYRGKRQCLGPHTVVKY